MPLGFEHAAKQNGTVKTSYRQSSVIQKIQASYKQADDSVKHGVCMGFSACWINQSAKGNDFWKWLDSPQSQGTLQMMAHRENNTITSILKATGDALLSSKIPQDLKDKLSEKQNKWASDWIAQQGVLNPSPRIEGKFDGNNVFDALTNSDGFKLLCMRGTTKGSHAVAAFVKGNEVTYVDPNGGEVKFNDKYEFGIWFVTEHLPHYDNAKFTDFYIDDFPCAVNPSEANQQYKSTTWVAAMPSGTKNLAVSSPSAAEAAKSDTSANGVDDQSE